MAEDADSQAQQDNVRSNTKAIQGWTSALSGAVTGAGQFAGALVSGSTKIADYTGALGSLAKALPIPGMGALSDGLNKAATVLDEMNAGYKSLSRSGFSLRGSLSGTALAASDAGYSVAELGKFAEANAKQLRIMGGTGGRATAMFAQMSGDFANSSENYVKGLSAIGYSNEEINESLVNFASINRLQFLENVRTGTSQNRSAMAFAVSMDRMATLTNQSRKELAKKMEEDRRNGRVQAFLAGLNKEQQVVFNEGLQMAKQNGPLAAKAYEDMMMQASLTGESANAAAVYGSEYIDNLAGLRQRLFSIEAGDKAAGEAFRTQSLVVQGEAMDSLRSQGNIQLGMLRGNGGIIKDIQDALAGSVDMYDQISLVQAQSSTSLTSAQARLRMAQMTDQELRQAGLTKDAEGNIRVAAAADAATDAVSSFESTMATASRAVRTELITTLLGPAGVGEELRTFARDLDSTRVKVTADITKFGTTFREEAARIAGTYETPNVETGVLSGQAAVQAANNRGNSQEANQTGSIPNNETSNGARPNNSSTDNNMFGGMMDALRPSIVGERGPEFLIPKGANNLIATAQTMAKQIAPQMQQMAEQMRPQMEQMAAQFEPQLKQMASQFQQSSPEMGQQMEVMMAQLNGKFDQLLNAYKDNTREIRRSGGNVYRT